MYNEQTGQPVRVNDEYRVCPDKHVSIKVHKPRWMGTVRYG